MLAALVASAFTIEKRIPGRKIKRRCVKPHEGNIRRRHCSRGYKKIKGIATKNGVNSAPRYSYFKIARP